MFVWLCRRMRRWLVKSEIRISKSETNSKFKCSNDRNGHLHRVLEIEWRRRGFRSFGFWFFDIVSSFEFRASDLQGQRGEAPAPLWGAPSKLHPLDPDPLLIQSTICLVLARSGITRSALVFLNASIEYVPVATAMQEAP